MVFQSFDFEHTWWRWFQNGVVCTNVFGFPIFRLWAYLKVISETRRAHLFVLFSILLTLGLVISETRRAHLFVLFSILSTLSVPDDGYSRNASCPVIYLVFFQSFDFERTWRWFQKRVVRTYLFCFPFFWLWGLWFQKRVEHTYLFCFPFFRLWAYLMMVIPETHRAQ